MVKCPVSHPGSYGECRLTGAKFCFWGKEFPRKKRLFDGAIFGFEFCFFQNVLHHVIMSLEARGVNVMGDNVMLTTSQGDNKHLSMQI